MTRAEGSARLGTRTVSALVSRAVLAEPSAHPAYLVESLHAEARHGPPPEDAASGARRPV